MQGLVPSTFTSGFLLSNLVGELKVSIITPYALGLEPIRLLL
jgi:hypothetical protein